MRDQESCRQAQGQGFSEGPRKRRAVRDLNALDTVVRHDPYTAAVCTFVSHLSDARAGRWGAGLNVGRDNPRCIAGVFVQRYRCRAIFWRHYARRDASAGLQVQGGAVGEGLGAEPLDEPS